MSKPVPVFDPVAFGADPTDTSTPPGTSVSKAQFDAATSSDMVQAQVDQIIQNIPEQNFFAHSQQFRDIVYKFLKDGEESLTSGEIDIVKQSKDNGWIPEGRVTTRNNQAFWDKLQRAETDEERESIIVEHNKKFQKAGDVSGGPWKMLTKDLSSLDKWLSDGASSNKTLQQAHDRLRSYYPSLPELDFETKGMTGLLEESFEKLGLGPTKPGGEFTYWDWELAAQKREIEDRIATTKDPEKKKTLQAEADKINPEQIGKQTELSTWIDNAVTGLIRLGPELASAMIDNPYEFTKGMVTFIPEGIQTLAGAVFHGLLGVDKADIPENELLKAPIEKMLSEDPKNAYETMRDNPVGPLLAFWVFKGAVDAATVVKQGKASGLFKKDYKPTTEEIPALNRFADEFVEKPPKKEVKPEKPKEEPTAPEQKEVPSGAKVEPAKPPEKPKVAAPDKPAKVEPTPLETEVKQAKKVATEEGVTYDGTQEGFKKIPTTHTFTIKAKGKEGTIQVVDISKAKEQIAAKKAEFDAAEALTKAEIVKPEKVDTGFESSDAARNVAHTERFIQSLQEAILDPARKEQKPIFEQQLAEAKAELKGFREEFDLAKERLTEEATPEREKLLADVKEAARAELDPSEFLELPEAAFDKVARDIVAEIIEPRTEKAGGLGVGKIFPSLGERFAKGLQKAKEKRKGADLPSMVIERPPKQLGITTAIRTPSNVFGAIPGQKARYGEAAQTAQRTLMLSERDIMVETGIRNEFVEGQLNIAKKDKASWGKNGEEFYDHVVNPKRDAEMSPEARSAAQNIRSFLETERQEIIARKRDNIRLSVEKVVNREWRAKNDLKGRKLTEEQKAQRDAAVEEALKDRVPDDWGIENYLPQMHHGNWEVWADVGLEVPERIGFAKTPMEALDKAMEHYGNHPELAPEAYKVTGRAYTPTDVTRISQANLRRIINEIAKDAENSLSQEAVATHLRGKLGAKEAKGKFAPFTKERKGFEGYSKNIADVLEIHNQQYVRWKELTDLNKQIQPLTKQMRAEGRTSQANEIDAILEHLWGRTPSKASLLVDGTMQSIPGVRDHVNPMMLERSLGRVKGGVVTLFLDANPRFHLLNSLQRFQTTLPILKLSEWQKGMKFFNSPEGKAAMDQFGVRFITRGKLAEGRTALTKPGIREKLGKLAPETYNQETVWAMMYKKAKDMGYEDAAANNYAFLKGNVYTQFAHLSTDTPRILRGPIASMSLQFKRFPIKNLELGYERIESGDVPGATKWLGAQLLIGGAKNFTKLAATAGVGYATLEAYNSIKEEHGKWVADAIAWGLPALMGLDMSYSFQIADMPYGDGLAEMIGNVALGPVGSVGISATRAALDTKGTEESAAQRALISATQRVPGLKWIDALRAFGNKNDEGTYDFRDPAGRLKFKGDLKDVILRGLGGRSVNEAEMDLYVDALNGIYEKRNEALDKLAQKALKSVQTGEELDFSIALDWNELWPEFPIGSEALTSRVKSRYKTIDLDKLDRALERAGKAFFKIRQIKIESEQQE